MMQVITIVAALFATMASAGVISPAPEGSNSVEVAKRNFSGDGTYYALGLGACGVTNNDNQAVVAISTTLFDTYPGATANPNSNPVCGRQISVSSAGKSPQIATVEDRCGGCGTYDIDMSPSLFETVIGDLSIGRAPITWNWV